MNSSQEKPGPAKRGTAAASFHLLDFPLGFCANITNASARVRSRSQKRSLPGSCSGTRRSVGRRITCLELAPSSIPFEDHSKNLASSFPHAVSGTEYNLLPLRSWLHDCFLVGRPTSRDTVHASLRVIPKVQVSISIEREPSAHHLICCCATCLSHGRRFLSSFDRFAHRLLAMEGHLSPVAVTWLCSRCLPSSVCGFASLS